MLFRSLLAIKPPGNERYYAIVFGSQGTPRKPRYTHTWATAIKVTQKPGTQEFTVEQQTISWLPATLFIRPLRLRVEPGINLDLHATIDEVRRNGELVSIWGPFEIWYGLYHRFIVQKKFLDSGVIGYQCADTLGEAYRCGTGTNCIHAITDMDPKFSRRQVYALRNNYGDVASANIVSQIMTRAVVINPEQTHDWLIPALDLDKYSPIRRPYRGPSVQFSPEAVLQSR